MTVRRKQPPKLPNREVLAGLVEHVSFHNPDNGFCVLRVKARGHRVVGEYGEGGDAPGSR